ncbi:MULTISPECIES: YwqI/YxiC family protein [Bacillaceae]|uniref:YwqI/YxiC family protein n=1 Tax=Bacillaceae TaxID=186817 RepID=UPI001E442DA6|nr:MULTISPECIES: YwqI/YxiC family protein [Bacillaceae]MCE4049770.1 YwqI/YxiC family protein [Bacillus sp. Au-Bac7]MCM3032306.1 YwqI/YxiC family protein [Niallia sp. MER 6]MDL0435341.1 YwqI/YxiC family protein [Niallia sp. SS-2023]UPO87536.1 YwqI/YxiC family protein [Niallia sp. Man26]
MATIKLNHANAISKLSNAEQAVHNLDMSSAPTSKLKDNKLDFTSEWKEREERIENLIEEYKKIVLKNVADTKDNIDALKEQDEAITR